MTSERRLTAGQEGSEEALQVLQLLHATRTAGGCSLADVCALLQMSQSTAKAALKGLYYRGRAYTDGHSMAARWQVKLQSERIGS